MTGAMASNDAQMDEAKRLLPDVADALRHGRASFSQLCQAWSGRQPNSGVESAKVAAYEHLYPELLLVFQASHGILLDFLPVPAINAYAARTDALGTREGSALADTGVPERARKSDMHVLYDLSKADFGGQLLTRIEMMTADASRLLSGQTLEDCLDQIFSTTGDLFGLIVNSRTAGCATPAPADKLAIIDHDLRVTQQKYLITTARLKYFEGALLGTLVTVVLALVAYYGASGCACRLATGIRFGSSVLPCMVIRDGRRDAQRGSAYQQWRFRPSLRRGASVHVITRVLAPVDRSLRRTVAVGACPGRRDSEPGYLRLLPCGAGVRLRYRRAYAG